jgi:RHS repeat-associated protein
MVTGAGSYPDRADSRLVSPPFTVPNSEQNPRLIFWHWFDTETGYDYGWVQVRPRGGDWVDVTPRFTGNSSGWTLHRIDLSGYGGQVVELAFNFHSDRSYQGPGWYIDDLEIRCGPEYFPNPEDFSFGWGDWYTDNWQLWQIGVPTAGPPVADGQRAHSPTECAATVLGGNYWANSSGRLISPSFTVPATDARSRVVSRFWQWYQYGAGDSGQVQISASYGTAWSEWSTLLVAAANGTSANWEQVVLDLTAYQGQQVRLGFQHTANNDGSVGAGWYLDDLELSAFIPTPLNLGNTITNEFAVNGQRGYYLLLIPAGGHLRVTLTDLDGLGANELYLRRGALPSPGAYDYRFKVNGAASQTVLAPDAGAGQWYVLAYNAAGPVPGSYELKAELSYGVALESVNPASLGNSAPGTLTLEGAGFTPDAMVTLFNGATSYAATDVSVVNSSRILAEFDFTLIPPQTHALQVTCGTNTSSLPFTVSRGGEPKFYSKLIVPQAVGRRAPAELFIEYANVGQVAMPAPLLVLTGTERPILKLISVNGTFSSEEYQRGFWTATMPAGWSSTVQFLACGKSPGVLQPGESNRISVAYAGLQTPWSWAPNVRFDLGVMTVTNTTPVDWAALKSNMRPSSLTDEPWDALWQNFTSQAGETWGDYVRMLNGNASYLQKLGLNVSDLRELLAFEFAQADGLNIVRSMATATDAYAPTPGLALAFGRVFPQSLSERFTLGVLGRGWSHNWDFTLVRSAEGDVTVNGPGGSRRLFQPDSRGGWFSQAGDHGTLTDLGGGRYALREPRGLLRIFGNDGRIEYVEDPNGNRITATWSDAQLLSLTHSSGQTLQFVYSAGLLQSVTDPVGRTTTFHYDGGSHLTNVTQFDGNGVAYTYLNGQGLVREHALNEVTYPGGLREIFSYNAQGRIESMAQGCCGGSVNFAYDAFGTVVVSDSLTNRTKFYLDHHGLLAKVENPLRSTLRFAYDNEFNLNRLTDPAGRETVYDYDSRGNLTQITDALGGSTRFSYSEPFNRLAQLMDAKGNITQYGHDTKGNLSAITYANSTVERWSYDSEGNPITWTNRRTQGIAYQFNTSGQLTAKLYPDGSQAIYEYDPRGNLILASNYTGAIILTYDTSDRLQRITYPGDRWLDYTYNSAGQRESMTDQLGYRLDYGYDAAGRLHSLTNSEGVRLVLYEYDPVGRLDRKTLGNNVFTTYTYDSAGQLLTLTNAQPNGTAISFFNYTYNSRGRRIAMDTHYGRWSYGYDDLGQLTNAVLLSTSTNVPSQDLAYVYDPLGNRVRTIENGAATEYTINNMNQYERVGDTLMMYDADGSLKQKLAGATTLLAITNNFANRVIGFVSTNGQRRFDYDALGFPAVVWRDGERSLQVHDPVGVGNLVATFDESGSLVQRAAHGFGALAVADAAAQRYPVFDAVGNVSDLTDSGADPIAGQQYAPFGGVLPALTAAQMSQGFGGEFGVGEEVDLVFMRARFYDKSLGRFCTADPLGLNGGDFNLHRFARNSPLTFADPSGLSWEWGDAGLYWEQDVNSLGPSGVTQGFDTFGGDSGPGWIDIRYGNWGGGRWSGGQHVGGGQIGQPSPDWSDTKDWADQWFKIHDLMVWLGHSDATSFVKEMSREERLLRDRLRTPTTDMGIQRLQDLRDSLLNQLLQEYAARVSPSESQVADAVDPNSLVGPSGYSQQNFVAATGLLPYRINFENYSNATAPAQFVYVTNVLSTNLDPTKLELSSIGFGDRFFNIPSGTQHYERTEHVTYNGVGFDVQIEAGLNLATRTVYARFRSINPTNGLPPTVDIGFLPPENGTGRGQGHLAYTIRPHAHLATGTEIRNVAEIKFDYNEIIRTDQVDPHDASKGIDPNKQALVTIDADSPSSGVTPLPAESSGAFTVAWDGTDAGAGIAAFDIYVSADNGAWTVWLAGTAERSGVFNGAPGHNYRFYSIARDGAGNAEPPPGQADSQTDVTSGNLPPVLSMPDDVVINETATVTLAILAVDFNTGDTVRLRLLSALEGASLNVTNGVFTWTPTEAQGPSTNVIVVAADDDGLPPLSTTNQFTIILTEVDSVPVIDPIGDQTVDEMTLLTVTVTASDPDIPTNRLTFSLVTPPDGATIHPDTGLFTWTPTEVQGPSTNVLFVRVTDDGVSPLSTTNQFTVIVREVNRPPATDPIGDQTVDEMTLLTLTVTASDPDVPTNRLAFSLVTPPDGATIHPDTGVLTWTPTEAQGPSTNVLFVRVTDDGVSPLSTTNQFTVIVREVNRPPVIDPLAEQTVDEMTLLTVAVKASDRDIPTNRLSFSLVTPPDGATIHPDTGVFTWTPTEVQGPSTNVLSVRVTDDGVSPLSTTNQFTVVVREVNRPPVIDPIAEQAVDEMTLLTVTVKASDPDAPTNRLAFSLVTPPTGATIHPDTGVFTWTPTEAQGPSTNVLFVRVTDDGVSPLSTTNQFKVVVNEVNRPPVIDPIADQTVDELTLLSVTVKASDPDIPTNGLAFSLVAPPAGAAINPDTGVFTWTPTEVQGPSTNVLFVRVIDDGVSPLSTTNQFKVIVREVNRPPVIDPIADQTVDELVNVMVRVAATDPDFPTNKLTFTLLPGAPGGMFISGSGVVVWTPGEAQGPSTNLVSVKVTDDSTPRLSATVQFFITVNEINLPPVMEPVPDQQVDEFSELLVQLVATDTDLPANSLGFRLVGTVPAGASITPAGQFAWTPTESQGPSTNSIVVVVDDHGVPSLSATNRFFVVVNEVTDPPLVIERLRVENGQLSFEFRQLPRRHYRLEEAAALISTSWGNVHDFLPVQELQTTAYSVPVQRLQSSRFYRLVVE